MTGMNRQTGAAIAPSDHLAQSVADILSTPVGSRVMRRDYGSELSRLIDAPMNADTIMDIYMETAVALAKWEPRLTLSRVQIAEAQPGRFTVALEAVTADGSRNFTAQIGGRA